MAGISLRRKCLGPIRPQQRHHPLVLALNCCKLCATTIIFQFLSSVSKDSNFCTRPPPDLRPTSLSVSRQVVFLILKFCSNTTKSPPGMLKAAVPCHPMLTLSRVWCQKLTAREGCCPFQAPALTHCWFPPFCFLPPHVQGRSGSLRSVFCGAFLYNEAVAFLALK